MSVLHPIESPEDQTIKKSLSPKTFGEMIGLQEIVAPLRMATEAAARRNGRLDHVLLSGPPGTGKSTLASILDPQALTLNCPQLRTPEDIISALVRGIREKKIQKCVILEEVHALKPKVVEVLYPVLETGRVNTFFSIWDLSKVTFVGTTTLLGKLPEPFRDRFGINLTLRLYGSSEMLEIVKSYDDKLSAGLPSEVHQVIAFRSRGTPRIAIRLIKRLMDYAPKDAFEAENILDTWQVYEGGLSQLDKDYLDVVKSTGGKPVSLRHISASLGVDTGTIENIIEPFLIRSGKLLVSSSGRYAL